MKYKDTAIIICLSVTSHSTVCEGTMKYHWCSMCDCISLSFHTHSVQQDIQSLLNDSISLGPANSQLWTTTQCHWAVFSFDRVFLSPPSTPIGVLVVLATPVNNYLKWQGIQLVSNPQLVYGYSMSSYNNVMMPICMQASVFPPKILYLIVCVCCTVVSSHIYIHTCSMILWSHYSI